jgi:hypothetical protein
VIVRFRALLGTIAIAGLLVLTPREGHAQLWQTTLTVAGWPLTVTSTSGSDFEAGFISLGSTTFTVNATSNFFNLRTNRTTTVQVQCLAACPRSGTLALAGLQWRRADQATWTTLTAAFVTVEQRSLVYNGTNDPWGNTIFWRYLLSWTANPPTAATQFRIQFRMNVTAP